MASRMSRWARLRLDRPGESGPSRLSELIPAQVVSFEETPPTSSLAWHVAPHRQFVITVTGHFVTRDGEGFRLDPSTVLLAEDAGGGRRWSIVGDAPWQRMYVRLPADAEVPFTPDPSVAARTSINASSVDLLTFPWVGSTAAIGHFWAAADAAGRSLTCPLPAHRVHRGSRVKGGRRPSQRDALAPLTREGCTRKRRGPDLHARMGTQSRCSEIDPRKRHKRLQCDALIALCCVRFSNLDKRDRSVLIGKIPEVSGQATVPGGACGAG